MYRPRPRSPRAALRLRQDRPGRVRPLPGRAGAELVSTGGTAKALREAGLPVKDVSDLTGFPEMMDGRVKTLHPAVHGGLLGVRDAPSTQAAMAAHGIGRSTSSSSTSTRSRRRSRAGAAFDDCIENIDIGGPAMIRSAAKNHADVAVVHRPRRLSPTVLAELADDGRDHA